ncbi:MAG: gliding motility-associated C-terminal domain-containing protein [Luteibaculaceae bacterium]
MRKINFILFLFFVQYLLGTVQAQNTDCSSAALLCANSPVQGTTAIGEPFNFPGSCFAGPKTVWYYFDTGSNGGDATVSITNLVQTGGGTNRIRAAILGSSELVDPCGAPSALSVVSGRCPVGSTQLQVSALNLLPNRRYWVLIDGLDLTPTNQLVAPAEVSFQIMVSGSAVELQTSGDVTIFAGGSTVLEAFGSTDNNYTWSPNIALNTTQGPQVTAEPMVSISYRVDGVIGNCTLFSNIQVRVVNDILPYEIITPNGDGLNDVWDIPGLSLFPRAIVRVYDVKGQLVFESIGYPDARRWDGTRNGNPVPAGVYVYVIDLNVPGSSDNDLIHGKLTVVR